MSGNRPGRPEEREADINALLDGELDEASVAALKAAASEDVILARAIVEAWQLQKGMVQLGLEKAPASLSRRLKDIPRQQQAAARRTARGLPRWALAGALASLLLAAITMLIKVDPTGTAGTGSSSVASLPASDAARLEQTQRELAVAFHYLDKVGFRVGQEINQTLADELAEPIKDNLSRHMPYSGQSHKEKHA